MKHLALATSVLLLLLSLLFWMRGIDHSGNTTGRHDTISIGRSPRAVHPSTWPFMPELHKRIPEVDLREVPLEDAIERLRRASGLNIVVQWKALESLGLDRETAITLKLHDASAVAVARAMLQPRIITLARPVCLIDENILILTADTESSKFTETHVYGVRDIILAAIAFHTRTSSTVPQPTTSIGCPGDVESVVSMLTRAILQIGQESWIDLGGHTGELHYFAGYYVITTTPEIHDEIARLLAELRKGK